MRRNFTKAVRVEIVKRAKTDLAIGTKVCEKCGMPCKRWEIHHLVMDAMETDKSRKLTAADGALWCKPCHDEETKAQRPVLAKARDREASHLGIRPAPTKPIRSAGFAPSKKAAARAERGPRIAATGPSAIFRRFV